MPGLEDLYIMPSIISGNFEFDFCFELGLVSEIFAT
jgi:hypothetical protein